MLPVTSQLERSGRIWLNWTYKSKQIHTSSFWAEKAFVLLENSSANKNLCDTEPLSGHIIVFLVVCALVLLMVCVHLLKRLHEILQSQYTHSPEFHQTIWTGRSNLDKTASSYIYLLFIHIITNWHSVIKFIWRDHCNVILCTAQK